jgi:hypothetical protein
MDTNESLMRLVPSNQWLQLERLTSDYDYCTTQLLDPLGIELPYDVWQRHVSRKSKNSSAAYSFPAWEDWTADQKSSFQEICGPTMIKLGYEH